MCAVYSPLQAQIVQWQVRPGDDVRRGDLLLVTNCGRICNARWTKGYGLGAMAMTAGSFHSPMFTVAWPTGEFGAVGLEGAVKLGYRKELQALPEGPQREAL